MKGKTSFQRILKTQDNRNCVTDMLKLKQERGITLIALVITIVILIILATVSINVVLGEGGLIQRAQEAKELIESAKGEEETKIAVLDSIGKDGKINISNLNENLKKIEGLTYNGDTLTNNPIESLPAIVNIGENNLVIKENGSVIVSEWKQNGYEITNGEITLKVGDNVNYNELSNGSKSHVVKKEESGETDDRNNETEDLGWRVLGIGNNGGIELISDSATKKSNIGLTGETGYLNIENILNTTCNELYGKGEYAESARSLKAEDVVKLADIKFNKEGGELWQFRFPETGEYMQYRYSEDNGENWIDWQDITNEDYQTYKIPGTNETISADNRKESDIMRNNEYIFSPSTYITNDNIRDLVASEDYVLANAWQYSSETGYTTKAAYTSFRFAQMLSTYDVLRPALKTLYTSYGKNDLYGGKFRPVVSLQTDVKFTGNSEEGWTISK